MLALDGGGTRGLVTLAILEEMERRSGLLICEQFDLIIGTSTGAVIAALLGIRCMTVAACRARYLAFAKKVFSFGRQRALTLEDIAIDDSEFDAAVAASDSIVQGDDDESGGGEGELGDDIDADGDDATPADAAAAGESESAAVAANGAETPLLSPATAAPATEPSAGSERSRSRSGTSGSSAGGAPSTPKASAKKKGGEASAPLRWRIAALTAHARARAELVQALQLAQRAQDRRLLLVRASGRHHFAPRVGAAAL